MVALSDSFTLFTLSLPQTQDNTIYVHWFGAIEPDTSEFGAMELSGPINNISQLHQGGRPLFLLHPTSSFSDIPEPRNTVRVLELLNTDVDLPPYDDTLYWCKVFRVTEFMERSQLIKVSTHTIQFNRSVGSLFGWKVFTNCIKSIVLQMFVQLVA